MKDHNTHELVDEIYYVDERIIRNIDAQFTLMDQVAWYQLFQNKSDQTFWRLDNYDKLQERFFVKLPSDRHWENFDARDLQISLLLKNRGTTNELCIWQGCLKFALQDLAYCERHAYVEMGIRK